MYPTARISGAHNSTDIVIKINISQISHIDFNLNITSTWYLANEVTVEIYWLEHKTVLSSAKVCRHMTLQSKYITALLPTTKY
jgi:hypothetical protein